MPSRRFSSRHSGQSQCQQCLKERVDGYVLLRFLKPRDTGGLLTMLTESASGTLAGNAHQETFNQVAKADAVMVSESLQRDFDAPLLAATFPGRPLGGGV